jgi:hypothetical protein
VPMPNGGVPSMLAHSQPKRCGVREWPHEPLRPRSQGGMDWPTDTRRRAMSASMGAPANRLGPPAPSR